jgi:phenylpropionate dioxygenase-like ring-hydroxylating dioxygenase large terminal subunit
MLLLSSLVQNFRIDARLEDSNMNSQELSALIGAHTTRVALEQAFYTDADIYERDVKLIFLKSWLYAGHISEIPNVGDWFLFELAGESVIIIRSSETEISALLNVCRHRGSRICLENKGCTKKLVCRYHAWVYELDGQLRAASHMPDDFDTGQFALKKIHSEILEGMIYVNFAEEPASFEPVREDMTECLRPYRIDKARVAHRQTYPINANWKLSVENYTECYHCAPSHPEYSRGHSMAKPGARSTEQMGEVMSRAAACGLSAKAVNRLYLKAGGFGADYSFERYPLWRGHITGSEDGQPVAPLMGDITAYDGGTTDFQVGPVTFALAYCDYIVIYRFTPVSVDKSECDITWLINGDAEDGKDYDKEKLIWLWDITTAADKRIIENNAKGVNSRYYVPGPFSGMEEFTWNFLAWYMRAIKP